MLQYLRKMNPLSKGHLETSQNEVANEQGGVPLKKETLTCQALLPPSQQKERKKKNAIPLAKEECCNPTPVQGPHLQIWFCLPPPPAVAEPPAASPPAES